MESKRKKKLGDKRNSRFSSQNMNVGSSSSSHLYRKDVHSRRSQQENSSSSKKPISQKSRRQELRHYQPQRIRRINSSCETNNETSEKFSPCMNIHRIKTERNERIENRSMNRTRRFPNRNRTQNVRLGNNTNNTNRISSISSDNRIQEERIERGMRTRSNVSRSRNVHPNSRTSSNRIRENVINEDNERNSDSISPLDQIIEASEESRIANAEIQTRLQSIVNRDLRSIENSFEQIQLVLLAIEGQNQTESQNEDMSYERLCELEDVKVPVPDEKIKELPILICGIDQISIESCSICLCEFENSDILRKTPCAHFFHEDCVLPWFKRSKFCPVCKTNVIEAIENNEDSDD